MKALAAYRASLVSQVSVENENLTNNLLHPLRNIPGELSKLEKNDQ